MNIIRDGHPQSLTCSRRVEGTKENKIPRNDNEVFKYKPVPTLDDVITAELIHLSKELSTGCYKLYPSTTLIRRTLLSINKLREQRI